LWVINFGKACSLTVISMSNRRELCSLVFPLPLINKNYQLALITFFISLLSCFSTNVLLTVSIRMDTFCWFNDVFSCSVYRFVCLMQMNKSNLQLHSRYIYVENVKLSWLTDTNYEYTFQLKIIHYRVNHR
jgi:hypothetical protein